MTATAVAAFPPHASICSLISFLSHHLAALLADPAELLATRRRCVALLGSSPRRGSSRPVSSADEDEEDDAVLAALQGAIDSFPSAAPADAPGGAGLLHDVEAALQAPALLPEDGRTAGRDNRVVATCAYFYLALVRAAQGDAWQMAAHFLQAVLVSPAALADGGLAPRALWDGLFDEAILARAGGAGASEEDAARRAARRYKDWLMYYRVVAAAPDGAASADGGGCFQLGKSAGSVIPRWRNVSEETTTQWIGHEEKSTAVVSNFGGHGGFAELKDFLSCADQGFQEGAKGSSDSRYLHEMLEEAQSDSPISFYSHIDS